MRSNSDFITDIQIKEENERTVDYVCVYVCAGNMFTEPNEITGVTIRMLTHEVVNCVINALYSATFSPLYNTNCTKLIYTALCIFHRSWLAYVVLN